MQSPPMPAPAITACGGVILAVAAAQPWASACSAGSKTHSAGSHPPCRRRIVDVMRRAIGADRVIVLAHVDENMRMIERRQSADAHEFLGADPHVRNARLIVKMRSAVRGHELALVRKMRRQHKRRMRAWIVFLRHRTYAPSEWRTHPSMVLYDFTILPQQTRARQN